MHTRAVGEEYLRHLDMAFLGGQVQGGLSIPFSDVDIRAMIKQQYGDRHMRGLMQGGVVRLRLGMIGTCHQQQD